MAQELAILAPARIAMVAGGRKSVGRPNLLDSTGLFCLRFEKIDTCCWIAIASLADFD
jgi:hypothetical protein